MDITEEIFKNKRYRKLVDQLSNETLELVANDHLRALKEAHRGIQKEEPYKINDLEYLEALSNEMQKMARIILGERAKRIY